MMISYLQEALNRAHYEMVDGMFCGTVPSLRGVIATGPTLEACRKELSEVVEGWVLVRVARGLPVPRVGKAQVIVRKAG